MTIFNLSMYKLSHIFNSGRLFQECKSALVRARKCCYKTIRLTGLLKDMYKGVHSLYNLDDKIGGFHTFHRVFAVGLQAFIIKHEDEFPFRNSLFTTNFNLLE